MRHLASVALLALTAFGAVSAQTTQIDRDTFEVASVHAVLAVPGRAQTPCGGIFELSPGRITVTGATVYRLLTLAYGMPCVAASNVNLVSGGPDWVQKDWFNIQATLPQGVPAYTFQQLQNDEAPKLQAMLRTLLADRFQLALHRAL